MSMDTLGPVGGAGASPAVEPNRERFSKVLDEALGPAKGAGIPVSTEGAPKAAPGAAPRGVARADGVGPAAPGCAEVKPRGHVDSVQAAREQQAAQVLDRVGQAQKRLDHILQMAQSGRSFSPAELLALQAHVYRASQELDLAGKVVEKATGGVKQVLQTQV